MPRQMVQREATRPSRPSTVPAIVHRVLATPGRPLDASVRAEMEPGFGHDFGAIRIHTDAMAAESARTVHATAYTVGGRIVFAAGRYEPAMAPGRRLIAHELAHTIQQPSAPPVPMELARPQDPTEIQATSAAAAVLAGRHGVVPLHPPGRLQRQDAGRAAPAAPARPAPGDLAAPPLATATVILVGSPTDEARGYDRSPFNFSNAAVEAVPKIRGALPGTDVTILYFSPGFRRRNAHNAALKKLQGTGATVVEVTTAGQVLAYLNTGLVAPVDTTPTRAVKISRFFYFGHGTETELLLNWGWGGGSESLDIDDVTSIKTEAFAPAGESYLFTCHIAKGDKSFMAIWASHLGQTAFGPQGNAAFNAEYSAASLERAINQRLPTWFLGLPYMNQVRVIDAPAPPSAPPGR